MLYTLSELVTDIKMELGIYSIALPVENLDREIVEVIKLRTLRTFSEFLPHVFDISINLDEVEHLPTTNKFARTAFILPDIFGNRQIIRVEDVVPDITGLGANLIPNEHFAGGVSQSHVESLMLTRSMANLYSTMVSGATFKFTDPNVLELYNFSVSSRRVRVTIAVSHMDNLSTIPASRTSTFHKLAVMDVKQYLYGMMRHHKDMQTPIGNINLNIDDWADAGNERREFITTLQEQQHLESAPIYVI